MLDGADHICSWPDKEVHLVRHLVKKMFPMSARESLDVLKILRRPEEVVFGCCSTTHAKVHTHKAYVRTHQYIGGYVLRPSDKPARLH
uniref:START domain-containing protein n=1 Tax=Ditylenchus dipsaci TaxID=166011 RepID=A0A915EJH8_9BILA